MHYFQGAREHRLPPPPLDLKIEFGGADNETRIVVTRIRGSESDRSSFILCEVRHQSIGHSVINFFRWSNPTLLQWNSVVQLVEF